MPNLTTAQVLALNNWARTQPALRTAFDYTRSQGVPGTAPPSDGFGDRLTAGATGDFEVPENPMVDYITSSSLAAGSSIDLDASTIASGLTGQLMRVQVSSTAPCRWDIKTRDGAVEVIKAVIYTSGLTIDPSNDYKPFSKTNITLAGNGVDTNFRVTVVNLGTEATIQDADVHATIEWDEV